MKSTKNSVIILIILMLLVAGFGRMFKLLEVKSIEAKELSAKSLRLETENAELKIPVKEKVLREVDRLFGNRAGEAKKIISCENSSATSSRVNLNKNGTADFGPFQINSIHAKRFGTKFMVDPIENVRVAYKIYQEQNWRPWFSSNNCHKLAYK